MKFIRFDDWRRLRGAEVEIWLDGTLQRTGVIDEATEDSAIAWVAADAKEPRRLLERASGFELRICPEQLKGARNRLLHDQAKHLYSRLAGLRARSLSHPGRAEQSAAETREVMKAISAREANLAEELWRKHIRNAATAAFQEPAALPAKKELAGLGVRP